MLFRLDYLDLARRDFTQSSYDFLVTGFDQWTRTLEQLFGAARATEHQLETVINMFEAVFNSYTSHYRNSPALLRSCQRRHESGTDDLCATLIVVVASVGRSR